MALTIRCIKCGRTLKVKPEFAGRTIRCSSCQSPLKVPSAEDEFGDMDENDEPIEDQRSPKQRRKSSSNNPSLLQKVAPYWFLGAPIISGIVALLSPMLGAGIGLVTLIAGVLLAAYGFLFAVLVDPVYALSPIARMTRSDAERKRIGKEMAPYFRSFGKGLLITVMGCLSVWISFELLGRGDRKAAMKHMAESREREDRRSPPGDNTGRPFPPGFTDSSSSNPSGVPDTTTPGTPSAMPAGVESPDSSRPDAAPVQPFPGQPAAPLPPSPPVNATRPVTPPVPREQLVPNAVMFAWVNGGWRPVIILKVISENRVSAIVPVFSADGQSQTSETQEVPIEDLRTPNPGEIPSKSQ